MAKKKIEVKSGDRYGMLTVLEEVAPYVAPSGEKKRRVKCKCDCRGTTIVRIDSLRKGDTLSCGCLQKQKVSEVSSKTNKYDLSGECGIGYICNGDAFYFVKKQAVGIALGIVAMTATAVSDYNKLKKLTIPVSIISIILLVQH